MCWPPVDRPSCWPTRSGSVSCGDAKFQTIRDVERKMKNKKTKRRRRRRAPLCFDEEVVWELGQPVVLQVQNLQLRRLQPLWQLAHIVPARQQLSEAPAGQQPATPHQHSRLSECRRGSTTASEVPLNSRPSRSKLRKASRRVGSVCAEP